MQTGIYSDEYVEILDGLVEGDQVVNTYTAKTSSKTGKNNNSHGGPPPM